MQGSSLIWQMTNVGGIHEQTQVLAAAAKVVVRMQKAPGPVLAAARKILSSSPCASHARKPSPSRLQAFNLAALLSDGGSPGSSGGAGAGGGEGRVRAGVSLDGGCKGGSATAVPGEWDGGSATVVELGQCQGRTGL